METLELKNVNLIYKNFAGRKEKNYNPLGFSSFAVILDNETAYKLEQKGWRVRRIDARKDSPKMNLVVVWVNLDQKPSINGVALAETMLDLLDGADTDGVDLLINPFEWSVGGLHGVKPYLLDIKISV